MGEVIFCNAEEYRHKESVTRAVGRNASSWGDASSWGRLALSGNPLTHTQIDPESYYTPNHIHHACVVWGGLQGKCGHGVLVVGPLYLYERSDDQPEGTVMAQGRLGRIIPPRISAPLNEFRG